MLCRAVYELYSYFGKLNQMVRRGAFCKMIDKLRAAVFVLPLSPFCSFRDFPEYTREELIHESCGKGQDL
jgi:hypothetical protein